jgi:hypothetical protein
MEKTMNKKNLELIEIVKNIMEANGTEGEIDKMIDYVEKNVPHPEITDLIFWNERDLTAEEIVEEALNYKPLILPVYTENKK